MVADLGRVILAARLQLRDLARRPLTTALLLSVPVLFAMIAVATTSIRPVSVTFALLVEPGAEPTASPLFVDLLDNGVRAVSQRGLSLVFLGQAAVSFLAAFLGFYAVHQRLAADRRLVLAGFRAAELAVAKGLVLGGLVLILAGYQTLILVVLAAPMHAEKVVVALVLGGAVYGFIGLILGAIARHELQGVLAIIFLANIDVGWLQNPIYYADTTRRWIVEALPGFGASQLAVIGAFTNDPVLAAFRIAIGWGAVTFVVAVAAIALRTRVVAVRSEARRRWRVLLATYLAWIISFYAVGTLAAKLPTVDPSSGLDLAIPLLPDFVWPYELTYVLPFAAPLVILDGHRFNRAVLAIAIASLSAYVVYFALPLSFPRPPLGDSWAERVLAQEYAWDFSPGANKLPSLHVAFTWILLLAARRRSLAPWIQYSGLALVLLISVSTLFVKQHVFADVIAGIGWAFASWIAAGKIYSRVTEPEVPPQVAFRQLFDLERWIRRPVS